jgi:hypothetical protein
MPDLNPDETVLRVMALHIIMKESRASITRSMTLRKDRWQCWQSLPPMHHSRMAEMRRITSAYRHTSIPASRYPIILN